MPKFSKPLINTQVKQAKESGKAYKLSLTPKNNYRQLKRLNTLETIYRRIIKAVTYNLLNAFWWCLIETRIFFVYHC